MSSDFDARIKVGADTREAEAGIDRVNEKVGSMGDVASRASAKASAALDGMGKSGEDAATKFTRSEAAMSSAMRRAVEQMEIAVRQGKSLSDAFQFKAEIRGFDASKFDPILGRMRDLESQLSVVKAAEEDFAAQNAFAKKHQQATELNKASQYTSWWAAELKKAEAAEEELAAQNAFAKKHQQATELAKASQYASWWAAELDKVEAAERKLASENAFISSLKAQSDAIGKTRADLLEMQAAQMGVTSQAAPFIAKMREAEAGMAGTGMSAKAMNAAMRGVPAQISDIVVSLQGGMPVMTVFMQQGFQLRDMFGGFGPAAKALGSTLLGLVNPYTVAAAGVAALGATMLHAESTLRTHMTLMNQLEATGRAGFLNADAVKQLKNDMAELPGISRSTASAIISDLVQVRTLGGEALQKIALMSADFAAATGQDAAGAAKELAKAMEEPDKAARALDEAFNFLTLQQLIAIDAMVEAGDKAGAQKLMLDALGQSLSGTAEKQTEMQKASKELSNAWDDFMQSLSPSVETMNTVSAGLAGVARGINSITEAIPRANAEITKWLPGMQAMMGPLGMWARIKGLKAIEAEASATASSAAAVAATAIGGGAGRGSVNPPLVGSTGVKSEADQDLSALLNTTKAFKAKNDAIEELNQTLGRLQSQQKRLRDEGRGDSKEAGELQSRIDGVNEKIKSLSKTRSDGSKKEQTAYAELAASIQAKIDTNKAEVDQSGKLNEAQKAEIKLNADLKDNKIKLSAAHEADLRKRIEIWKQQEKDKEQAKQNVAMYQQQLDIEKQITEDYLKRARALESARQAMDAYEKAAQEDHERLQLEAGLIGMSNQARTVALAQYDAELELKRKIAEIEKVDATSAQKDELIDRARVVSFQRMTNAQIKASNDEWSKSYDQASQSLSDALMDGGRNGADYVAGLFRSLVLRPVIQAIVAQPASYLASAVNSVVGVGPAGSAGGSGVGNLLSMFKDFGGGASNTINNIGGRLFNAGFEDFGESLMDFSSTLRDYSGVINTAGSVLSYGKALLDIGDGKYGSGIGTAVGQYFGGPIGATIGNFLGSALDKALGSRGANHSGAAASSLGIGNTAAAQKLMGDSRGDWYTDLTDRYSAGLETQLSGTVNALAGVYEKLSGYAGDAARSIELVGGFAVNGVHGDEGAVGYGQLWDRVSGQYLGGFSNRDMGTDQQAAWTAYVGQMGGLIVDQLKASDIPGWMRAQLEAIGEDVTVDGLEKALTAIAAIDAAFKGWADTLVGFSGLSAEAQTALVNVSGGIEGLAGNVNAFYSSFYSESERMATLQRQVLEQLAGLDVTVDTSTAEAAKESFRAAVEGALNAGSGELAAKLLALSGSFATAADYAAKAVETVSQAMEGLLTERRQLEAELLRARGDAAGYAAAMRAIATEGYTPAEVAAWDYNEALRAQITEAERAATATEDAASALASLRQQAVGIVQSQQQSLDSLIAGLTRKAEQASGGYVGNLWLSGAEFTQFAGFADQLSGATKALEQLQELGLGDELAGYADQIGVIVQQTKEALAGALSMQRLMAGDAAGALGASLSASTLGYGQFNDVNGFNAGGFNRAFASEQAAAAAGLLGQARENSLRIPNAGDVIGQLAGQVGEYAYTSTLSDLRLQGREQLGPMVAGLFDELFNRMAMGAAEGKLIYGDPTAMAWAPGYGDMIGSDLRTVVSAMELVNDALSNGRISAEEADRALGFLNSTFSDMLPLLTDTAGQYARAAEASAAFAQSSVNALEGAFGQLAGIVGDMDAAASAANSGLGQATNAIGLLNSMATVFGSAAAGGAESAMAAVTAYQMAAAEARDGAEWARAASYEQSAAEIGSRIAGITAMQDRGNLVAESAALASSILTTASAAKAAEELAGKITLGPGQTLRDLSLLVEGVGQYDNSGFYAAFARISDALGKGQIDEEQYSTLFGYMTATYQGVDQEAERAAQSLASLRLAAGSLADELLLGDYSSFSAKDKATEAVRQYDEVISLAMAGKEVSQSDLARATNTMLAKVRDSTTDPLEMQRRFGLTINQLRAVEKATDVSPEVKQMQVLQEAVTKRLDSLTLAVAGVKDAGQTTNRLLREEAQKVKA